MHIKNKVITYPWLLELFVNPFHKSINHKSYQTMTYEPMLLKEFPLPFWGKAPKGVGWERGGDLKFFKIQ